MFQITFSMRKNATSFLSKLEELTVYCISVYFVTNLKIFSDLVYHQYPVKYKSGFHREEHMELCKFPPGSKTKTVPHLCSPSQVVF